VDEEADARDEQHEGRRQRVEQQPGVDLEAADRDPAEQVQVSGPVRHSLEGEEEHDPEQEGQTGHGASEVGAPFVAALAGQGQDRETGSRQGEQQPHGGQRAGGGHDCAHQRLRQGRLLGEQGHVRFP